MKAYLLPIEGQIEDSSSVNAEINRTFGKKFVPHLSPIIDFNPPLALLFNFLLEFYVFGKLFLRSPLETKESPIILYVNYGGRRIKCATGLKIHPELWSSEDQSPVSIARIILKHNQWNPGSDSMLQIIKRRLSELRKAVDDYFSLCQINGNDISLDEIRSKIQNIIKPKQEKQTEGDIVCVFLEAFIADTEKGKRKGKNYKAGTIKIYRNLLQALLRFQQFYGKWS